MADSIHRRGFCKDTSVSAAGIVLAGDCAACSQAGGPAPAPYAVMPDLMRYRKIDAQGRAGRSKWQSNNTVGLFFAAF
jgi:hypothetical protein